MKKAAVDFCPVPQEQQPVYEYEQLKNSWLFCWATLELDNYLKKLAWVGFWGLIIAAPIASASFNPKQHLLEFAICSELGASILVGSIALRIYLGWLYIRDRLQKDRIFYEESGWYDGQTWIKPTAMLDRDRLIVSYQIQPMVQRLEKTLLFLAGLGAFSCLIWFIFG
ncbi:MAG: CGLD27 family protein [Pleurocapsa sp.]